VACGIASTGIFEDSEALTTTHRMLNGRRQLAGALLAGASFSFFL